MKNIEKKLLAYYKVQTENAPVISGTEYKKPVKRARPTSRRWLKVAVCAVLVLAIGIGFIGTDYQSFFTPPAFTPPAVLDDNSKEVQNDNETTDTEQSTPTPDISADDSSKNNISEDNASTTPDISIDTPIPPDISADDPTPPTDNSKEEPEPEPEPTPPPQVFYADEIPVSTGSSSYYLPFEYLSTSNVNDFFDKVETKNGEKYYKGNKDDLYYVAIKPKSLEWLWAGVYGNYTATENGKEVTSLRQPETWGEYKEVYGWIIEEEQKMLKSLGIDAKLHWYGFHLPNGKPGQKYEIHQAEIVHCPDENKKTENLDHLYIAYIKPDTLLNYLKLAEGEYNRTLPYFVEKLATLDARFYDLSKSENIDYRVDEWLYLSLTGALYFEKTDVDKNKDGIPDADINPADPNSPIYGVDTNGDGINDLFSNTGYENQKCTAAERSEEIQAKWKEYVVENIRPSIFIGGSIVHLPKADTEDEVVTQYIYSFNAPITFTSGVSSRLI